ncbi:MAG: helix-turn-helix transcriptional regulator [Segatella salivae]|jgi:hypothetical protein
MPVNKNAYLRYQILDQCFSNKYRKFSFDELVDFVSDKLGYNISPRQIRDDIANLRIGPYYAPIKATRYDGKKCFYHYADSDFSIFKNELTTEELTNLRSTIEMLNRYRGIPANAWLEEVISNLEYRFGVKANSENLISFEQNDMLKGLEHLSGLIDATINHQTIELSYKSYGKEKRQITVYPYYVKQYNGRWFLFGMKGTKNRIESYALDRIEEYSLSDKPFVKNELVDFSTFFDDVIGVSVPYDDNVVKEEIVLRFSEKRFPYVVSKPIHHTQKVLSEPFTISIKVRPNRELSQQIFSFMPDIEVVAPEWFRNEMRDKIQENLKKYLSVQKDCTDEE